MSEDTIFELSGYAYLRLIHPALQDHACHKALETVVTLSPLVPHEIITKLILGVSWRERLVGVSLAATKQSALFIEPMLQSLRDPRGISIVPICAALAVLARCGLYAMPPNFSELFDRQVFDGEIGWAADKAMHFAGLRNDNPSGRGLNYGQIFEDHIQIYTWMSNQSPSNS
jgi:hypothetical protein